MLLGKKTINTNKHNITSQDGHVENASSFEEYLLWENVHDTMFN